MQKNGKIQNAYNNEVQQLSDKSKANIKRWQSVPEGNVPHRCDFFQLSVWVFGGFFKKWRASKTTFALTQAPEVYKDSAANPLYSQVWSGDLLCWTGLAYGRCPDARETAQRLAVTTARRLAVSNRPAVGRHQPPGPAKPGLAEGPRHEPNDSRSPSSCPPVL